MKKKHLLATLIIIVLLAIAIFFAWPRPKAIAPTQSSTQPAASVPADQTLVNNVTYSCDDGKTITAALYQGPRVAAVPNEPPQPNGSAVLSLSDGRNMTLSQTISADGIRYANTDESFIFWSKGSGAFIQENGTTTFSNCEVSATGQ
ncbi:MAG TPA: MliC family protein [Candidatus Paceibacterota bacterium]|nr:MliC family protein [Candidatus Paceibacterota bacterium]